MQIEKREPNLLVFRAEALAPRVGKFVSGVFGIALGGTGLLLAALRVGATMESASRLSFLIDGGFFLVGAIFFAIGLAEAVNVLPLRREVARNPPCTWRRWGAWTIQRRACVHADALVVSVKSGFKDWSHFVIELRVGDRRHPFFRSDGSWRDPVELYSNASAVAHEIASFLGCNVEFDESMRQARAP